MQRINEQKQQQHSIQELKYNNLTVIEKPTTNPISNESEIPSSSTQFSLSAQKLVKRTKPKEVVNNAHKSNICFSVIEEQYQQENQPSRGSTTELQVELHAIKEEMNQLKSNMQILTCVITHIQNSKTSKIVSQSPVSSSQMRTPQSFTSAKRTNSSYINTEQEDMQSQLKNPKRRALHPLEGKSVLALPKPDQDNRSGKQGRQRLLGIPRQKKLLTLSFEDDPEAFSTAKRFKTIDNSYQTTIEKNRSHSTNNNTGKNKRTTVDYSSFLPQKANDSPKSREIPSLLGFSSSQSKQPVIIDQFSSPKTLGKPSASRFRSMSSNSNEGEVKYSSKNRKLKELKQLEEYVDSAYCCQSPQLISRPHHSSSSSKPQNISQAVSQSANSRLKYLEDSSIRKTNMSANCFKILPQNLSSILQQSQQQSPIILRSPSNQTSSNSCKRADSSERVLKKADLLAEKIIKNSEYLHSILKNFSNETDNNYIKQSVTKQNQQQRIRNISDDMGSIKMTEK